MLSSPRVKSFAFSGIATTAHPCAELETPVGNSSLPSLSLYARSAYAGTTTGRCSICSPMDPACRRASSRVRGAEQRYLLLFARRDRSARTGNRTAEVGAADRRLVSLCRTPGSDRLCSFGVRASRNGKEEIRHSSSSVRCSYGRGADFGRASYQIRPSDRGTRISVRCG